MLKTKRREIVCPHSDCFFFSSENVEVDGEHELITFCNHPHSELVIDGRNCNFYRIDWKKQAMKIKRANPAEKVWLQREAFSKLLKHGIGLLSPDERDAAIALIEQLKEQEERIKQLSDVMKQVDVMSEDDPFVLPNTETMEETIKEPPVPEPPKPARMSRPEPPPPVIEPEPVPEPVIPEKKEPSADDVVKTFIESYNNQDFDREYDCLGKNLRATSRGDYIMSRRYAYADVTATMPKGKLPIQEMGEVTILPGDENNCKVICDKIERFGRSPKYYQQKFMMKKEDGQWKISGVQTREK